MFKKPFNVKSNAQVRSSDRRKLLARFPIGSEISSKSTFSLVKILTANNTQLNVYLCDKDPVFFEFQGESNLFPTIYLMWLCPKAVPTLLIAPMVMQFIENGADLMLPGVHLLPDYVFPDFAKNSPVAIGIYDQKDASVTIIAVGASYLSSREMIACGMKGKGVNVLHVFQDALWEFGSKSTPSKISIDEVYARKVDPTSEIQNLEIAETEETPEEPTNPVNEQPVAEDASEVNMDELLTRVFLWSLKTNGNDIRLPIDVGQFYANYVLKQLPPDTRIDLKKTTFKKFSTFLKAMNEHESGPLTKIVNKKGIDSITEIYLEHELIRNAEPVEGVEKVPTAEDKKSQHARVSECYSVTEAVMPLLKPLGYKKADIIQPNQLRDLLMQYGQSKNLLSEDKKKIELDDTLQTLVRHFLPDKVVVNELAQKIGAQMTKAFVVTLPDGRRNVRRDKMPLIVMNVEKRAGNKHVTLLNNVSFFGIDPKAFCQNVQVALATGATINQEVPNCEGPQILIHGNHVYYIGELLQDEYGINKKYLKGLEHGVKPKKGKR